MRATLLDLLVGEGGTRIATLLDYNAAIDRHYAFRQGHLTCVREDVKMFDYYRHQLTGVGGLECLLFDDWEGYESYAWTAEQHHCMSCGGHLSNPPQHLTRSTDSAIIYTQSSATP